MLPTLGSKCASVSYLPSPLQQKVANTFRGTLAVCQGTSKPAASSRNTRHRGNACRAREKADQRGKVASGQPPNRPLTAPGPMVECSLNCSTLSASTPRSRATRRSSSRIALSVIDRDAMLYFLVRVHALAHVFRGRQRKLLRCASARALVVYSGNSDGVWVRASLASQAERMNAKILRFC